MRAFTPWAVAAGLALAACAPVAPAPRDAAACAALFRQYDVTSQFERTDADDSRPGDLRSDSGLRRLAQELTRRDCLTRPDDLAGLEAAPARAVVESGAPLPRPLVVHAGAVTGGSDAAVAFFTERGLQATSIGAPLLGRRVYVGPATTQGGLLDLILLATEAGFVAPYPTEDFRF